MVTQRGFVEIPALQLYCILEGSEKVSKFKMRSLSGVPDEVVEIPIHSVDQRAGVEINGEILFHEELHPITFTGRHPMSDKETVRFDYKIEMRLEGTDEDDAGEDWKKRR